MLYEATLQQGLEGIVSKRLTSRYVFGERTRNWLKFAHRHRRSYVVGGWRPQEGTADRLAALLVGELTEEGLVYRGRVGSGIGGAASRALTRARHPASPGRTARSTTRSRRSTRAGTFWVEPVLVVDVETHGVGYDPAAPAVVPRRPQRPHAHRPAGDPVIAELLVAAALSAGPAAAPVTLDGVTVQLRPGTEQVVTVNHTDGYRARVTFWKLTDTGWQARFDADDGRIGYGGLVRGTQRKQGTGTTPLGTYALPWAFGIGRRRRPAWRLRYREVAARRLLGAGQRVGLLQPLPQPGRGRLPVVAAHAATRTAPSG